MMALKLFPVMVVTVGLLAGRTTSWTRVNRQRRSDDGGPLEVVVEQLSQQVASLKSQLTEQANSFNALLSTANAKIAALGTKTATLENSVAFYAYGHSSPINTVAHGALILDRVTTNVGKAYDTDTGVFTVPKSGLYDFQATFMCYPSPGQKVYAAIYVGSQIEAEGVADCGHVFWDQTTVRSVVHVTSGQKVTLKNTEDAAARFYGYHYTSFSGFLLKAD